MSELDRNRLVCAFAELRAAGRKALLPFLTAGFPDLETTEALLHELSRRGVRMCELGFPFSDPVADGPVIQASYTRALERGVTSERVFEMVRRFRAAEAKQSAARPGAARSASRRRFPDRQLSMVNRPLALTAMVSYTIVYRHGVQAFLQEAASAGFDGTIVPDLPLEEAGEFQARAEEAGLAGVLLISPTTPPERRVEIARRSRGFLYFISVAGITGERKGLPQSTIDAVAELRRRTDTPVCVGFGISGPQTVRQVCRVADGAIVGSAIVRRIADLAAAGAPQKKLVSEVGEFVGELLGPLR